MWRVFEIWIQISIEGGVKRVSKYSENISLSWLETKSGKEKIEFKPGGTKQRIFSFWQNILTAFSVDVSYPQCDHQNCFWGKKN